MFTFFDQSHTTGANIAQDVLAMAIVTIGSNTTLRDVLQGVMRMRLLFQHQHVEFVIPKDLLKLIESRIGPSLRGLQVEDIINFSETNSFILKDEDCLRACFQKLDNCPRRFILDELYRMTSTVNEEELYALTESLFTRTLSQQLYENYADKPEMKSNTDILKAHNERLFKILDKANTIIDPESIEKVKRHLDELALYAQDKIPKFLSSRAGVTENSTVENEEVEELEMQLQQQVQTEDYVDVSEGNKPTPSLEISWKLQDLENILDATTATSTCEVALNPLTKLLEQKSTCLAFNRFFQNRLLISSNFATTLVKELNLLDKYQKTPHEVLVFREPITKLLKVALITACETSKLKEWMQTLNLKREMALMHPVGLILEKGTLVLDDESRRDLNRLLLEVLLFCGNIKDIYSVEYRESLKEWASTNTSLKKHLLENVLLNEAQFKDYQDSPLEKILTRDTAKVLDTHEMQELILLSSFTGNLNSTMIDKALMQIPPQTAKILNFYTLVAGNQILQNTSSGYKNGLDLLKKISPKYKKFNGVDLEESYNILNKIIFSQKKSLVTDVIVICANELLIKKEFFADFFSKLIELCKGPRFSITAFGAIHLLSNDSIDLDHFWNLLVDKIKASHELESSFFYIFLPLFSAYKKSQRNTMNSKKMGLELLHLFGANFTNISMDEQGISILWDNNYLKYFTEIRTSIYEVFTTEQEIKQLDGIFGPWLKKFLDDSRKKNEFDFAVKYLKGLKIKSWSDFVVTYQKALID